jgi:ATP-dependent exoDNAse (exonuclease V) beta subunit
MCFGVVSFFFGETKARGGATAVRPWGSTLYTVIGVRVISGEPVESIRDTIIVQGIIDLLIRTPQGLVIIDFKTDNITTKQVPQRAELYRQQLELYAQAASAILKDSLLAKWLYFLASGCSVEV